MFFSSDSRINGKRRKDVHMFGIWPVYMGSAVGILVEGDPTVPPTTWWNHLILRWFVWKQVVVFKADAFRTYRVGYRPQSGKSRISSLTIDVLGFAVRIGNEDCTFFAEAINGDEIPLTVVRRCHVDELGMNVPLI
jgi:hypothetical protein